MGFKELIQNAVLPEGFKLQVEDNSIEFYYHGNNYYSISYDPAGVSNLQDRKSLDKAVKFDGSNMFGYIVTNEDKVKFKLRFSDMFDYHKGAFKVEEGLLCRTLDAAVVKTISIIKSKKYDQEQYQKLLNEVNQPGLDSKLMKLYWLREKHG